MQSAHDRNMVPCKCPDDMRGQRTWLLSLTSGCHSLWSSATIPNRRLPGRHAFASAAHDPAERERCSAGLAGRASCINP